MDLCLTNKDGEPYDEFDVSEWISEENKKSIFDILAYFDTAIETLDKKQSELEPNKLLKSLINEINRNINLADEYKDRLVYFTETKKMWDAAREFIISKELREEFNTFCVERFKN